MAEYSRIASGSFVSTGAAKAIYLPFKPDYIEIYNRSVAAAAPNEAGVVSAIWDESFGEGTAQELVYNSDDVLIADFVSVGGISTFDAGLSLQYGPSKQIVSATAANPAVFTVTAHGYSVGDIVVFQGLYQTTSPVTGMPQLSGMPFVISQVTTNTFSVVYPANGSNFTALSGSPVGATVKKVLYPFLFAPGVAFVEAIGLGTTTTVTTTAPHNFVLGQEIAFNIPSSYGTTELNQLPNQVIPGSPVYYFVTAVNSATQFVCNAVSSGFTTFDANQLATGISTLQFAQVFAVGDNNTGSLTPGFQSPVINGVPTINGPAIAGAFVANSRAGFVIGSGAGTNVSTSSVVGANGNAIAWRAYASDM